MTKNAPSTQEEKKKAKEKQELDNFKLQMPDFPQGEISDDHKEKPDFIVLSGNRKIGIELTQQHRESGKKKYSMQEAVAIRHRICDVACAHYERLNGPVVDVLILFNEREPINKSQIGEIGSAIADYVKEKAPPPGQVITGEFSGNRRYKWFNTIHSIRILGMPPPLSRVKDTSCFRHPEGGYLPTLNSELLLATLKDKDDKVGSYLQKCDEIWLLIGLNVGMSISTHFMQPHSIKRLSTCTQRSLIECFLIWSTLTARQKS